MVATNPINRGTIVCQYGDEYLRFTHVAEQKEWEKQQKDAGIMLRMIDMTKQMKPYVVDPGQARPKPDSPRRYWLVTYRVLINHNQSIPCKYV